MDRGGDRQRLRGGVGRGGARDEQLTALEAMGERQADRYSELLADLQWPLNLETAGAAVMIETIAAPVDVAGLTLTLLSPDRAKLAILRQRWAA